jgi:hypothetical protein
VQALAKTSLLPAQMHEGRRLIAERPCLEAWVARMLGRVRYPHDEQVVDALLTLTRADTELVRRMAQASLAALRAEG